MNKQIKQLDKVTARIDDGELVFTLSGYLDDSTWEISVDFTHHRQLSHSWEVKSLWLSDEDEVETYLKDEYIAYIFKYSSPVVTIEKVDCEHDDVYVFENEDDVNECDRCGATLGN